MTDDQHIQLLLIEEIRRRIAEKLHWSLFRMPGIQTTDRLVQIENVVQFFCAQLLSDLYTEVTHGHTPWIKNTDSDLPDEKK